MAESTHLHAPPSPRAQSQAQMQGYNCANGGKQHEQAAPKSAVLPAAAEFRFQPSQMEFNHPLACTTYAPYADPFFSGYLAPYHTPHIVHPNMVGLPHARMPLPLEMTEEPVYVNAKQYHGILRRRQLRAKAESENKLIKTRKPYLHESRHLHAMKRARGDGGRFLNTKKSEAAERCTEAGKLSDGNSAQTGSSSGSEVLQSDPSLKEMQESSGKSRPQVPRICESEPSKNDISYPFSQDDTFSNHYEHSHFHMSAFHSLPPSSEDGNGGQNAVIFSGGPQQRVAVIQ